MLENKPHQGPFFYYVDQSNEALTAMLAEADGRVLSYLFSLADDNRGNILRAPYHDVTEALDEFTEVVEARIAEFNSEPNHVVRIEPDRLYTYLIRSDSYPKVSGDFMKPDTLSIAMLHYGLGRMAQKKYSPKNPLSAQFDEVVALNWNIIHSMREEMPFIIDRAEKYKQ